MNIEIGYSDVSHCWYMFASLQDNGGGQYNLSAKPTKREVRKFKQWAYRMLSDMPNLGNQVEAIR